MKKGSVLTMTMGERIKQLRIQHNMSMNELGSRLGVGKTAIFKYENGQVENLPRSTIEKMAVIFGVSPSYLMCFDEWDKNSEALSDEVILIERIQAKWGNDVVTIIQHNCELNTSGQKTLCDISESLCELSKYKK
jgi:transcriptional regulator with XRE-family HTH domain